MAWSNLFRGLFRRGLGVADLAQRLGMDEAELRGVAPTYTTYSLPKRSGGVRRIDAPSPALKAVQQRLLRRVLAKLRSHPNVTGFERGHSIVTNACGHARRAVVVRMDLRAFFNNTGAQRITRYFRKIGWNADASDLLTKLVTHEGGLPQGAPTSPRLSNLVNFRMDARLAGLARRMGALYTRYADDLTFSFERDEPPRIRGLIRSTERIVRDSGYELHKRKKLSIRRRHQQQRVTGLVVNSCANLPRSRRRWLRAVQHHLQTGRSATLTGHQLAGWWALQAMVSRQVAAISDERPMQGGSQPS